MKNLNWPPEYNHARKKMYIDYIMRRSKFLRMTPREFLIYKEAKRLLLDKDILIWKESGWMKNLS